MTLWFDYLHKSKNKHSLLQYKPTIKIVVFYDDESVFIKIDLLKVALYFMGIKSLLMTSFFIEGETILYIKTECA